VFTFTKIHDRRIANVGVGVRVGPVVLQLNGVRSLTRRKLETFFTLSKGVQYEQCSEVSDQISTQIQLLQAFHFGHQAVKYNLVSFFFYRHKLDNSCIYSTDFSHGSSRTFPVLLLLIVLNRDVNFLKKNYLERAPESNAP